MAGTRGGDRRVVLVHGSLATGPQEWEAQRPLADDGWDLLTPTRRSYAGGTATAEDFTTEADDVVGLLGDGAHLVGHSSGGMVAMLAAAARPDLVRSLTLVEPPAFRAAPDHPAVKELLVRTQEVFAGPADDARFLRDFLGAVGTPLDDLPADVVEGWVPLVPALREGERPWDVDVPVDALAAIPTLVVSGGHHPAFTAICEALAEATGGEHAVVTGAGHEVQMVGEAFNDVLRGFWQQVG